VAGEVRLAAVGGRSTVGVGSVLSPSDACSQARINVNPHCLRGAVIRACHTKVDIRNIPFFRGPDAELCSLMRSALSEFRKFRAEQASQTISSASCQIAMTGSSPHWLSGQRWLETWDATQHLIFSGSLFGRPPPPLQSHWGSGRASSLWKLGASFSAPSRNSRDVHESYEGNRQRTISIGQRVRSDYCRTSSGSVRRVLLYRSLKVSSMHNDPSSWGRSRTSVLGVSSARRGMFPQKKYTNLEGFTTTVECTMRMRVIFGSQLGFLRLCYILGYSVHLILILT
jgi:hypothetical protein